MLYNASGSYVKEFTTFNSSTGAVNADSLPVATANHNGTDDSAFALTVTNIDAGRYKITGTVPSGYVSGDVVNVSVDATVGGITGKAVVDTFVVTPVVRHDMTQPVPTSNTAQTVGDAFNAARAQGFGKWVLSGTTLTLYAADGTTSVHSFTLDSATNPTQRS